MLIIKKPYSNLKLMILNRLLTSSLYGSVHKAVYLTTRNMSGIVEDTIRTKLQTSLKAKDLVIINESYMHNVPKDAETHFKVVVVSDKFEGMSLIKRHRLVHNILKEELKTSIHALSIVTKTPAQWGPSDKVIKSSPACKGGFGK